MMARLAAWGVGLLATLAVPAVLALLVQLHGEEALLALAPADKAVLMLGLFLPPALLVLAIAGLVGMFFALLGWTGMVTDATKVWGANPTIWFVLGLIIAVAAAVGDTVLGRHADFTQGRADAGSTLLNRLLPWIIVALTLVGMLVVKLTHG